MTDQQTIEDLRRTFDAAGAGHHLKPGLGAAAWSAAHGSRPRKRLVPAIAGSVLATAAVAGGLVVWGTHHDGGTQTGGGSACAGSMTNTPLPVWARGGFSPAGIRTPHVIGKDGRIVAVPFVRLRVHQPEDTGNKVLWVSKAGYGPLRIEAKLEGTSQTVTRVLPNGPGPSYVDMPAAGCWQMSLTWSGRHDSVALRYYP